MLGALLTGVMMVAPTVLAGRKTDCIGGDNNLLGMHPWYHGLINSDCTLMSPKDIVGGDDTQNNAVAVYVTKIALNILYDLSLIAGYVAIIFIIVGGYQFLTSSGEPGKAARGKKTLTSAIVGLVIALLAAIIMNTISSIIIKGA